MRYLQQMPVLLLLLLSCFGCRSPQQPRLFSAVESGENLFDRPEVLTYVREHVRFTLSQSSTDTFQVEVRNDGGKMVPFLRDCLLWVVERDDGTWEPIGMMHNGPHTLDVFDESLGAGDTILVTSGQHQLGRRTPPGSVTCVRLFYHTPAGILVAKSNAIVFDPAWRSADRRQEPPGEPLDLSTETTNAVR